MKDFNIIINKDYFLDGDWELFFGDNDDIIIGECIFEDNNKDLFDIFVKYLGYSSKKECKRNFSKYSQIIPDGYSEYTRIGKLKHNLYILKLF